MLQQQCNVSLPMVVSSQLSSCQGWWGVGGGTPCYNNNVM